MASAADPYWTVSHGVASRTGHSCRQCGAVISKGDRISVRDGRRMRLFYHAACFSGESDPRTQGSKDGRLDGVGPSAPASKGAGKWSVSMYGLNPATSSASARGSSSGGPTTTTTTTNSSTGRPGTAKSTR